MSHNDSILNLLNIKDQNITFDSQDFCVDESFNGVETKIFRATLTYTPEACHHCGAIFDEGITKHGFKTSTIKLPSVSSFNAVLKLRKQRYICTHCHKTFTLHTSIVRDNCQISNNSILSILSDAKTKTSEKDIAMRHGVSHSSVNRFINSSYEDYSPDWRNLPSHLCFDEFKSVKAAEGAMSFIYCDASTGELIDIVEDRRLSSLRKYFSRYDRATRHRIKTITIDMYSPYMTLIKELFPHAKIIIDKFHIVQLFSRALNKTRIQVMNRDKKNYNKLKRYWRLLLMDFGKIETIKSYYSSNFKRQMREIDILEYLLDLDPVLRDSYFLYQEMMGAIRSNNKALLNELLDTPHDGVSAQMKTALETAVKYRSYFENTLTYRYTNGVLEGLNNKIKVVKRIAFGYRCFIHFRTRILLMQRNLKPKAA